MITPTGLQNLTEVMTMMADTERLLAELYRNCAETWKEDREFWLETVAEEEKHARNIEQMQRIVTEKPERFEIGRPFNVMAIKTIRTGLERQLERIRSGQFTREQVLNVARDIEGSLIEKSYGDIVRTSDVEYRTLVKEIVGDTLNHKQHIEERIRAIKAGRL